MSDQLLVSVLSLTIPAGEAVTLPHGLKSNGVPVAPTLAIPNRVSSAVVTSVTPTTITVSNPTSAEISLSLRVERGLSMEVEADEVGPTLWQGTDGFQYVSSIGTVFPLAAAVSGDGNVSLSLSGGLPADIHFYVSGVLTPGNVLYQYRAVRPMLIGAPAAGFWWFSADVQGATDSVFTIEKQSGGIWTPLTTVTFTSGSLSGFSNLALSTPLALANGLRVVATTVAATFRGLSINMRADVTGV